MTSILYLQDAEFGIAFTHREPDTNRPVYRVTWNNLIATEDMATWQDPARDLIAWLNVAAHPDEHDPAITRPIFTADLDAWAIENAEDIADADDETSLLDITHSA